MQHKVDLGLPESTLAGCSFSGTLLPAYEQTLINIVTGTERANALKAPTHIFHVSQEMLFLANRCRQREALFEIYLTE